MDKVDIAAKFSQFSDHWRPKIVAELNGQEMKLVKVKGEFPWHHHDGISEMFFVWRGQIRLEFRDHVVEMGPGECLVVPPGVEHRPVAASEAEIILFEPANVLNTGNVTDETYTAPKGVKG